MKKIGFIGVGIMGKSMVRNLMKAGFEVAIYTRTKAKVEDVIAEGAIWRDTVKECVADRDAVISIVGYPKDVEEVYFGENGILKNLPKGGYAIDMTTSSPKLAVKIYETARAAGLHALDAPVTGGDGGAKAGTLTILAGGDRADFDACMPLFEAMGKNINYEGKAGNGQRTDAVPDKNTVDDVVKGKDHHRGDGGQGIAKKQFSDRFCSQQKRGAGVSHMYLPCLYRLEQYEIRKSVLRCRAGREDVALNGGRSGRESQKGEVGLF